MRRSNGISIEDVMEMECMEQCSLIAGFGGVRNTVSKVNIMADPDVLEWVEAGELLLTTAYPFREKDIPEQVAFIQKAAKTGLAGIGIKIRPYLDELPADVLQLANQLSFPIIALHDAIPFTEIMTPIFQEIFNKQATLLQRIEKIHEQLMHVMLTGGGMREILKVVAENVRNPVLLKVDTAEEIFTEFGEGSHELQTLLLENAGQFFRKTAPKGSEQQFLEMSIVIQNKRTRRMVIPIIVRNQAAGYLMAWAVDTPLGGFDLSVMEAASTTIALETLKQLSVRDVENRYRAEFFEDLISLDLNRKQKALEMADRFELQKNDWFVMLVVQILNEQAESLDETIHYINWLIHTTEAFLRDQVTRTLIISKTDSLHILFSGSRPKILQDTVSTFSRYLLSQKSAGSNTPSYRIGIGRHYKGLDLVHKSFFDAVKAIRHGPLIGENELVYFEQLGIYKILSLPALREELEHFYQVTLQPLVEYDRRKSTELVKTLEVYYQQGGNLRKTSDALFTHYNTTLYRIESIQKVTGLDLSNHKDRLNLEVALKIRKLLNN